MLNLRLAAVAVMSVAFVALTLAYAPSPEAQTLPSVSISGPRELDERGSGRFKATGSNLFALHSYDIRLETTGGIGFNDTCSSTSRSSVRGSIDRRSYTRTFTLYGCSASEGTVTATLWDVTPDDENPDSDYVVDTTTEDITVVPVTPTCPNVSNRRYEVGDSVSLTLPAASGGDGTLTYTVSGLPPGLSYSGSPPTISGSPTIIGSSNVTYQARDTDSDTCTKTFNINVTDTPTPTMIVPPGPTETVPPGPTETVPPGPTEIPPTNLIPTFGSASVSSKSWTQNEAITAFTLPVATGGDGTLTYSLSPALPAGVTLTTTRRVSGTPTAAKERTAYTWTVTDANGDTDTETFTITVAADLIPTFGNASVSSKSWRQNEAITVFTLPAATGGDGALTYSLSPALPAGVTLNTTTRRVSGTPTATMAQTTYTWKVRDADGDTDTETFTITVAASLPAITIAAVSSSVTEGQNASFELTASPAPAAALTVNVSVNQTGAFLTDNIPSQITVDSGSTTAYLILQTDDDGLDEDHGVVTATILADKDGEDYLVGNPSSASITITDNDDLPAPTGLRANGHVTGGEVTLRWESVSRAISYNVRYAACPSPAEDCSESDVGDWHTQENIATTGEGTFSGVSGHKLVKRKLYRVQVQAVAPDHNETKETSDWSDFVFLYPEDGLPTTKVGTIPIASFQPFGVFDYVLCEDTVPEGISKGRIKSAIRQWPKSVVWDYPDSGNIVQVRGGTEVRGCDLPSSTSRSRNQVIFLSNDEAARSCRPSEIACWTTKSLMPDPADLDVADNESDSLVTAPSPQSIVLRETEPWNDLIRPVPPGSPATCIRLQRTTTHEAGHAYGFRHITGESETVHSIMYRRTVDTSPPPADPPVICKPTEYDIVAMMANYQARPREEESGVGN